MAKSIVRLLAAAAVLCVGLTVLVARPVGAADEAAGPEPAPPANQEYTGTKRCASCHFDQYMRWSKSPHAKAFDLLPANYKKDPKCVKCHTTGFGEATGFKDAASTPALVGVSCEVCHGPGSEHEKVSKPFAQVKNLTPEQEKAVCDSIWKMTPKNVCVECHLVQGHKDSMTPKELQKKK